MIEEKSKHGEKYEDILMRTVRFNEEDLEANRSGTLSRFQLDNLHRRRTTAFSTLFLIGLVGVLVIRGITMLQSVSLIVIPGIIAFFAFILMAMWKSEQPVNRDIREKRVMSVEGLIRLTIEQQNKTTVFYMEIEGERFDVSREIFLAFKNGDSYRIYYTPNMKKLLSVEWLR